MKKLHMIFKVDTDEPFHKSSGVINYYIKNALTKMNFDVATFHRERKNITTHAEKLIPLNSYSLLHKVKLAENPSITIYDDHGLSILSPSITHGHHNVLFLHGLRGNPGSVLANKAIDLYCCNSKYLENVLKSFFYLPDFKEKKLLSSTLRQSVKSVRLPIPLLDYKNGYNNEGSTLPDSIYEAIAEGFVLGHSIQRDKPCPIATVKILLGLNKIAKNKKSPLFKLVISDLLFPELKKSMNQLKNQQDDFSIDEISSWFIAVPLINNKALVSLIKISKFSLCYNRNPESFGIYPLESILLGCPVYTNGIGNIRWLLPSNSGIYIYDSYSMAFEHSFKEYEKVSQKIFYDIESGDGFKSCQLGKKYIELNHCIKAFEGDLNSVINSLYEKKLPQPAYDNMLFTISPLVRSWCRTTGKVISDVKNIELTLASLEILKRILGKKVTIIDHSDSNLLKEVLNLFYVGVISLEES